MRTRTKIGSKVGKTRMNNTVLWKVVKVLCVCFGLGLISWGLWGYDPRWAMMSSGIGLFLIGIGII